MRFVPANTAAHVRSTETNRPKKTTFTPWRRKK